MWSLLTPLGKPATLTVTDVVNYHVFQSDRSVLAAPPREVHCFFEGLRAQTGVVLNLEVAKLSVGIPGWFLVKTGNGTTVAIQTRGHPPAELQRVVAKAQRAGLLCDEEPPHPVTDSEDAFDARLKQRIEVLLDAPVTLQRRGERQWAVFPSRRLTDEERVCVLLMLDEAAKRQ